MKKLCLALFVGSICFSSFSFNAIAVPPKPEQTIEQLKQAAEKGNIQAQFQLGENYFSGTGVSQDTKQAAEWYLKAGEQGNAEAQFKLGTMYVNGFGVRRDYEQAISWYESRGTGQYSCTKQYGDDVRSRIRCHSRFKKSGLLV